MAPAHASHASGPSQTKRAAGSGSGSHGSDHEHHAAPRRGRPRRQPRPAARRHAPGERGGHGRDEHTDDERASPAGRRARNRRAPAGCGPRARGPGRRPPAGRRAGPIGAVFGPFSGRERMLPYAGRCPCRATTPRRARGRGSPVAARSRRSPSCSRSAFTYPIAPRLGSVGRFDTGDGHWSIWCVAWVSHALATDPAGLFDANIFVPHRDTLAYSENNIVAGVLGLPAYLLTGNPYATHNLSMLLGIGLAFVGAYALARYLTRDTGASIVAAIGFAFCPFLFARTAHIQLMLFFGLPIAMLAMHRLVDAPSTGRGVRARPGARGAGAGLRLLRHLRRAADRARPAVLRADARPLALGPLLAVRGDRGGHGHRPGPPLLPALRARAGASWASPARSKRPPTTRPTSRPGWPRARGRTAGSCRGSATGTRCSSPAS